MSRSLYANIHAKRVGSKLVLAKKCANQARKVHQPPRRLRSPQNSQEAET